MTLLRKLVLTAGAIALLCGPAQAQPPRSGGGTAGGGPFMLLAPEVRNELKLSRAQAEKVPPTLRDLFAKNREAMQGLRDLDPRERLPRQRALMKAMNDEAKKALDLSADQVKRFDQISLQARRFEAFTGPEVQEALKLTDAQKAEIKDIAEGARGRMQEIFRNAKDDPEEVTKQVNALSKEMTAKALALLTDAQKATWKDMTGAPFEVPPLRPRNN